MERRHGGMPSAGNNHRSWRWTATVVCSAQRIELERGHGMMSGNSRISIMLGLPVPLLLHMHRRMTAYIEAAGRMLLLRTVIGRHNNHGRTIAARRWLLLLLTLLRKYSRCGKVITGIHRDRRHSWMSVTVAVLPRHKVRMRRLRQCTMLIPVAMLLLLLLVKVCCWDGLTALVNIDRPASQATWTTPRGLLLVMHHDAMAILAVGIW